MVSKLQTGKKKIKKEPIFLILYRGKLTKFPLFLVSSRGRDETGKSYHFPKDEHWEEFYYDSEIKFLYENFFIRNQGVDSLVT